ncbi:HAD family hydrolase [Seongchinamella sediminis]|uniref:HAD family hydrolase n=1 Tax=Seongchinamella sediminis TaxID=2283635 RepID=A0A3L7DXJ9_9GAMM|nr:HAD-IA family hydrolase [Seongchinamella sediminis]RLQ20993.1 HAD family hydrolase [Seongchinamella sediminis]
MAIKVITFDLDNTLWDVDPALIRAEEAQRRWLLEHRPGAIENYDHQGLWEFKKSLWQRHPELLHNVSAMRRQMLLELQLAAGYPQHQALDGARQAFDVFLNERHRVQLYEQALDVLGRLASQFSLGALTNGNADIYKTDAGEYFDFAFLAEECGASKPAPDMFHAAIARSGAAAHEIVHVGDNPEHDIRGALEVGMYTVWINLKREPWPGGPQAHQEVNELAQLPDAITAIQALP